MAEEKDVTVLHSGYFTYVRDNRLGRNREVLRTTNSVSLLVYVEDQGTIILVQQPREPRISATNPTGMVVESISGRFDGAYTVKELAVKEAHEEAGLDIYPNQVEVLNFNQPMSISAGALTEVAYLCLATIQSSQVGIDVGIFSAEGEDERIERMMFPVETLDQCIWEDVRVFALIKELQLRLHRKGVPA